MFKKAREVALEVDNFQISCITKTSYIDTTQVVDDLPEVELAAAKNDPNRHHGSISPTLRKTIIATVLAHGALTPDMQEAVVN